jgi:acetyltransferase
MDHAQDKLGPIHTTLPDGTVVAIRPVTPEAAPLLVAGFEHLSPQSRYRRFLESIDHLTPQQVQYLTHIDGYRHIAWGAVVAHPETGEDAGIAVARCVRDRDDPTTAEFAIAVVDEWQGCGVGSLLARCLAERAWEAGIRRFRGYMLASNKAAQHLMASLGTLEERHYESPGVMTAVWRLHPPGGSAESGQRRQS